MPNQPFVPTGLFEITLYAAAVFCAIFFISREKQIRKIKFYLTKNKSGLPKMMLRLYRAIKFYGTPWLSDAKTKTYGMVLYTYVVLKHRSFLLKHYYFLRDTHYVVCQLHFVLYELCDVMHQLHYVLCKLYYMMCKLFI